MVTFVASVSDCLPTFTNLFPVSVTFFAVMSLSIFKFSPARETFAYSTSGVLIESVTVPRVPPCGVSSEEPEIVPLLVTDPLFSSPESASSGMSKVMVAPFGAEAMVRLSAPVPPKAARATSLAEIEPAFSTDLPTR